MELIKKVVAIGPESSGKSTLCERLAKHFDSSWCPEYARSFLMQHGKKYTYDDLLTIAKGQVATEDARVRQLEMQFTSKKPASPDMMEHVLFIDTDLYVMKVWCEFVFGKCHEWILENIASRKYDLYLLCNTDLPWVKDELREYPDLVTRDRLFHIYHDLMINQTVPWINISGNSEERLNLAGAAVLQYCKPDPFVSSNQL